MGHGGHHGGGSHVGSHHSGGGFHGGHSGGGHYSGGHYSGGYSSSGAAGLIRTKNILTYIYCGIGYTALLFYSIVGGVPGINFVNFSMFNLAGVFFILGLLNYKRTSSARKVRNGVPVAIADEVGRGRKSADITGYECCWIGTKVQSYRICFSDQYYGKLIREEVKESISKGSKIVWMNQYFMLLIGGISFIGTFALYESVIPIFEDMYMDDILFMFVDDLVFYLPSIICLAASVVCFVSGKIRDKLLYKCAVRLVKDIEASEKKLLTEAQIASQMQMKRYYLICPNCGANYQQAYYNCMYCGSSLEVR